MINVTAQILKFRNFLLHAWNDLDLLIEKHDWDNDGSLIEDWLQANWEFLVERELLKNKGFLISYSNLNFRITNTNAVATHEIICKEINNKQLIDDKSKTIIPMDITITFAGFVTRLHPGYGCYPPFDYATVFSPNKKEMYKVSVENINFYMCKI